MDICPAHVLEHTLATLTAILRKPGVRLKPFMVRHAFLYTMVQAATAARSMPNKQALPRKRQPAKVHQQSRPMSRLHMALISTVRENSGMLTCIVTY